MRLRRRIEKLERERGGRAIFVFLGDPYAEVRVPVSAELVAATRARLRAIHGPNAEIVLFVFGDDRNGGK